MLAAGNFGDWHLGAIQHLFPPAITNIALSQFGLKICIRNTRKGNVAVAPKYFA